MEVVLFLGRMVGGEAGDEKRSGVSEKAVVKRGGRGVGGSISLFWRLWIGFLMFEVRVELMCGGAGCLES